MSKDTRGTAYIVYEDIYDAKTAVEHLSGFNVANRYLIVLYYNTAKQNKKASIAHSRCNAEPSAHVCCSQAGRCAAVSLLLVWPEPLRSLTQMQLDTGFARPPTLHILAPIGSCAVCLMLLCANPPHRPGVLKFSRVDWRGLVHGSTHAWRSQHAFLVLTL